MASYRLWETPHGRIEPYAALSYCWGGDQTFKTTLQTISQHKKDIKLGSLPQTLQDAIFVTEQLGLKYLWIDALCIIQDDAKDKSREISQMARVYGNATVTIAASRAKAVWEGFLSERPSLGSELPDMVFSLPCQRANEQAGNVILVPLVSEPTEPLDLRGWTFQERVLSNQVLDFGSLRTQWICRANIDFVLSDGWSNQAMDRAYGSFGLDSQVMSDLIAGRFSSQDMLGFWMKITKGFANRALSFSADKLPAIAGMAECFGVLLHDDYLAGLWRSAMPASLLWSNRSSVLESRSPHDHVSAPTWSWAAIDGPIEFDRQYTDIYENVHFEVQIQDCQVSLVDEQAPYGAVRSGELKLKGHMQRANWVREGIYGVADKLLAAGAGIPYEPGGLGYGFSKDRDTGIGFMPDALETEFLNDPASAIEVCLVLFGSIVFSDESGLFPSVFGLVLRPLPGGRYSRLGVFKKAMPGREFVKYMRWFRESSQESFVII